MHEQIIDALRRGANEEALEAAREAVAADAGDAQAHRWLAAAQRASGASAEALGSIDRAIALAPDDAGLQFERAGLLLDTGALGDAQAALERTTGLDPNQFGAYIVQAQLALGRGDLAEAERLQHLAARIAPEHVWIQAIEGMLALRRGDAAKAQAVLSKAAETHPDDVQVRYALGFAYMAAGHHAFAEQAFRGVADGSPQMHNLRGLIAELMRRQGRFAEAAAELAPSLSDPERATPALHRFVGELHLAAGDHAQALPPLETAFAREPRDRRTLVALVEAWRRGGTPEEARAKLDAALATTPELADLWRARLAFETPASDGAQAVVARWLAAMPDFMPALETQMGLYGMAGQIEQADAVAQRIVELQPGHGMAEMRLVDARLRTDPPAAIAYLQDLLARAESDDNRKLLRSWLALAHDRAGEYAQAADLWRALQQEAAPQCLPLPELTVPDGDFPALAEAAPAPATAFLVGAPGSGVEKLATLLAGSVLTFRSDRFGQTPPQDPFQSVFTPQRLAEGQLDGPTVAVEWRAALAARGLDTGEVVDWLLWWDNALLHALRPALPHALLLIALRDPRDALLDWLAFGAPAPLRIESPTLAAQWLAREFEHLALLHERDLFPHRLLRLDEDMNDPAALARRLGEALDTTLYEPPASAAGPPRFAAGHWRHYREALAEPFALLAPVALRLGYPEA